MMNMVKECVAWNAARYPQVLDGELAISLLQEEIEELFKADTDIDKLDACGDITFVAIGVLWKMGLSEEEITNFFYETDLTTLSNLQLSGYMSYVIGYIMRNDVDDTYEQLYIAFFACSAVFVIVMQQLKAMNMQSHFYTITNIICESNNTKEVVKTVPNVKANIVKGSGYVGPEKALAELLEIIKNG